MPIQHEQLSSINSTTFKAIDYKLMGAAFAAHNRLGHHFNEEVYRRELADAAELQPTKQEFRIRLTHGSYSKDLFVDLIIDNAVPCELKASSSLHPKHDAQLLQYMHLTGITHGKLINFGSQSVQGRYLSTTLTQKDRRNFQMDLSNWDQQSPHSEPIVETLNALLLDWGTCLTTELYSNALTQLIDGAVQERLTIEHQNRTLGKISATLVDASSALILSGYANGTASYTKHLRTLLRLTKLQRIHWINLDKSSIQFTTLA